jgi:hypothetical protein
MKKERNKMCGKYSPFPYHLDVQPITSILSYFEFDSLLEECFNISGSLLACVKGSS